MVVLTCVVVIVAGSTHVIVISVVRSLQEWNQI